MKVQVAILLLSSILASSCVFAQEKAIIKDGSLSGGFGSIHYMSSNVNGGHQDWISIGGGVNIEHFFFGVYGQSTIDNYPWKEVDMNNNLTVAHGGAWVGYTYRTQDIVHLYSSIRFGAGKAILHHPIAYQEIESIDDHITQIQPEIGIEINLTNFLRLGGSLSYSFYDSLGKIPDYTNESLSGFKTMIGLRIGRFE